MSKSEKGLQKYLQEDELVCWHGVAERFPLLDTGTKRGILLKWFITVVTTGAIVAGTLSVGNANAVKAAAMVAVIGLLIFLSPILDRRRLLGQEYWITDRRAIMMARDGAFYSVVLAQLDEIRILEHHAAYPCFLFGSKALDKEKNLRWRASRPMSAERGAASGGRCDGLIFYCTSNAQGARDLLTEKTGLTLR